MTKDDIEKEVAFRDAPDWYQGDQDDYWDSLSQPAQERYEVLVDIVWQAATNNLIAHLYKLADIPPP